MIKVLQSQDFQVSQTASLVTAPFTTSQAHPPQSPSQSMPRLFPQPGLPFSSISTKQPSSFEILHRCCFLCKAFLFQKPWAPIKGNPFFYARLQHVYPINHFTLTELLYMKHGTRYRSHSLCIYVYICIHTNTYIYIQQLLHFLYCLLIMSPPSIP